MIECANLKTLVQGSTSVAARSARTSASSLALVLSAYWNGARASRKCSPNCRASVRATRRRKTSPITSAHTARWLGQCDHAAQSQRISDVWCRSAPASLAAARPKNSVQISSSRSTLRCSLVQAVCPAAGPRHGRRRLASTRRGADTEREPRLRPGAQGACREVELCIRWCPVY